MSAKKLAKLAFARGRVMWLDNVGDLYEKTPEYGPERVLVIPLSDPSALVEAIHSEYVDSGYGSRDIAKNIAKRLGVPAKLLKERKKK